LASTLGNKYWVKARTQRDKVKPLPKTLECEEYGLYEKAIIWLKEANIYTPDNLEMKWDLFNTLYNRAVFTFHISQNIDDFDVTCQLLDQALSDCQEASKIFPDETLPYRLSEQISQIKGYS
jgi:hypothetical protein